MVCSTPNSSISKRPLVFLEPNCSSIRGASVNSVVTSDMIDKESSSANPSQVEETKICRVTPAANVMGSDSNLKPIQTEDEDNPPVKILFYIIFLLT
ncbi:hypothetical protein T12_8666 [Trichinella patagoniensis]|uniref:Uncharacterized protein n=1 Tax=Trichinella patagoniensis TaxID=990121 RepID=A0A0V0YX52_9BILA|nr:hypothetical protein T12_8666 [Trichinella patagoniensis]